MTLYICLAVSVLLNVAMAWYMYRLLRNLIDMSQEFDNISVIFQNFSNHLKTVHETETYYGDKTLEALINHMKIVEDSIDSYTNNIVLFGDEEQIDEQSEEER